MPSGIYQHKPQTEKTKRKNSLSHKGLNTWSRKLNQGKGPSWKGENAGYNAKHKWMEKEYGKPDFCEHCLRDKLKGREIHWANISGEYKRERNDWLRLCIKCHFLFDKLKRLKK